MNGRSWSNRMRSARNTRSCGVICSLAHSISLAVASERLTFLNRLTMRRPSGLRTLQKRTASSSEF